MNTACICCIATTEVKISLFQIHKDYASMETESFILNNELNKELTMSVFVCMQYCLCIIRLIAYVFYLNRVNMNVSEIN